ncbi:carbon starvation induced protein CsiD [Opitutia bacterium ISCC 51]|nr:carbon starvation induced protein CsiD [Opitutae bacterium ISCC 51]QXD29158.1 carbon starvation induced protein CsiD [Opitutae bacterium ISCC 52]
METCESNMQCTIIPHPMHHRMFQITLDENAVERFLDATSDLSEESLSYIPYLRSFAADCLQDAVGTAFAQRIHDIIHDRETGAFTLKMTRPLESIHQQVALGTAISHLIGLPNFDDMTNNFYACFTVKDTDESDSYLRQAYRTFTLHTDGTYVKEPTDWILMMKMDEQYAEGGDSRLLHLDDWNELDRFLQDPVASVPISYKSPPSKNYPITVKKPIFYEREGKPCVCFIDQFVYPDTLQQGRFLKDLCDSMETSSSVVSLPLPTDQLVVLNNHFWLHGRAPFEKHPGLHRVMMRQRGYFRGEG